MTTGRYLTVKDFPVDGRDHERATGEFVDELGTYRKTCDDCGADVTDPTEGAEAEALVRKLRGESVH